MGRRLAPICLARLLLRASALLATIRSNTCWGRGGSSGGRCRAKPGLSFIQTSKAVCANES
eukprot:3358848-Pyramimonas_sp.AAC.1